MKVQKILSCYSKEDGKEVGVQTDPEVVPEGSDNTRLKTCFLGKGVQTEPLDCKCQVEKKLDILEQKINDIFMLLAMTNHASEAQHQNELFNSNELLIVLNDSCVKKPL